MDQGMNCPMCGAHVASEDEMQGHENMHKTEGEGQGQSMKCPMCGATFTTKEEMDKHARKAHNQSM